LIFAIGHLKNTKHVVKKKEESVRWT